MEAAVLNAEYFILARLSNRIFFSLAEVNPAIGELVGRFTQSPFKKFPGCRQKFS